MKCNDAPCRELPNGRGWLRLVPPMKRRSFEELAIEFGKVMAEIEANLRWEHVDDYIGGW
jgi:hypothetical protein